MILLLETHYPILGIILMHHVRRVTTGIQMKNIFIVTHIKAADLPSILPLQDKIPITKIKKNLEWSFSRFFFFFFTYLILRHAPLLHTPVAASSLYKASFLYVSCMIFHVLGYHAIACPCPVMPMRSPPNSTAPPLLSFWNLP